MESMAALEGAKELEQTSSRIMRTNFSIVRASWSLYPFFAVVAERVDCGKRAAWLAEKPQERNEVKPRSAKLSGEPSREKNKYSIPHPIYKRILDELSHRSDPRFLIGVAVAHFTDAGFIAVPVVMIGLPAIAFLL